MYICIYKKAHYFLHIFFPTASDAIRGPEKSGVGWSLCSLLKIVSLSKTPRLFQDFNLLSYNMRLIAHNMVSSGVTRK